LKPFIKETFDFVCLNVAYMYSVSVTNVGLKFGFVVILGKNLITTPKTLA